jgi:hypothetical protein
MCLYIKTSLHPSIEPSIAEEDMEVVKVLLTRKTYRYEKIGLFDRESNFIVPVIQENGFFTPYMRNLVIFDDEGKCVITGEMDVTRRKVDDWGGHYSIFECPRVDRGVHSLSPHEDSDWYLTMKRELYEDGQLIAFDAIIPKGTPFFTGCHGDFVSEKLIVTNRVNIEATNRLGPSDI